MVLANVAKRAVVRLAGRRFAKAVVSTVAKKLTKTSALKTVGNVLSSKAGTGLGHFALGVALPLIPVLKNYRVTRQVGDILQVEGLVTVGDAVLTEALDLFNDD